MARVFRVQQVLGDGTPAGDRTFPFHPDLDPKTGKPYCDAEGRPFVEIQLRPVSKAQYREIVKAHTTAVPTGAGQMEERIDWVSVNEDVAVYAIVGWRGIVGADDRPLLCIDGTKRVLDVDLLARIRDRAVYAQPAEVTAASFREPALVS